MEALCFADESVIFLLLSTAKLTDEEKKRILWVIDLPVREVPLPLRGSFVGPRSEMITPWSTNATDIIGNMGVRGVVRMEEFRKIDGEQVPTFDPMLEQVYRDIYPDSLNVTKSPAADFAVENLKQFNETEGLALSDEEIAYLEKASRDVLKRPLTDSEIYGFAQINSEHCRHKIFNGTFVLDGKEQPKTLFAMIRETSKASPENIVSAYKDNVAFVKGPEVEQFRPAPDGSGSDWFGMKKIRSVLSLKAETHNFPTTVEPFYGASTGSGGEIRDRMAGGRGSIPLVGTSVYMTSYPRMSQPRGKGSAPATNWEKLTEARDWKYQTPSQILLKASNGASDFGNKFGQPLIVGSLLTFEGKTSRGLYGYDRAVMLAGGVGYANSEFAAKEEGAAGDTVVVLGGDNYRIGMAGGSVSSVDTGQYSAALELSAVQRANPEMQKRVYNVVRALTELEENPVKLIHDHGAGGHMNCLAELVEPEGGSIDMAKLPIGDTTLSSREILSNESQERMGLIVASKDVEKVKRIAERERAPFYAVGEINGEKRLKFTSAAGKDAVSLPLEVLFGAAPKVVLTDEEIDFPEAPLELSIATAEELTRAIDAVLSLESVACKDWLTNKVDRCVTGLVALQQCTGPLQLPLNNLGVSALSYASKEGIATAIGHAPVAGLIDAAPGARLSVAESLTNIVWAPLKNGVDSVVLSANWMWPAKQPGENSKLYQAVQALSQFAIELGIAVPTGKDSLSMTMKYNDGTSVRAPGTVVVSSAAWCDDISVTVTPDLKPIPGSRLMYVDISGMREFPLGGSSLAQTVGQIGNSAPDVKDAATFKKGLQLIQKLVRAKLLLAGHDVSSGGAITAALEMAFAGDIGIELFVEGAESTVVEKLFCEKPAVVLQIEEDDWMDVVALVKGEGFNPVRLGEVKGTQVRFHAGVLSFSRALDEMRRVWFAPSALFDAKQRKPEKARERFENLGKYPLRYSLPSGFTGRTSDYGLSFNRTEKSGIRAAIIREQGTNGDRELAFSLYASGFDVKDITMVDLINGREDLSDVQLVAFPGGFANSDVFGSARGWAGAFLYNERAYKALTNFYKRPDTLSIGICNGCQLVVALNLLYPDHKSSPKMLHNDSGRFECAFTNVRVEETNSVFLKPLIGSRLGIWVAHGEGRFALPEKETSYDIPMKYCSTTYPANPNGASYNAAAISSVDGRHLAIMPHLERSLFTWNWPYWPSEVVDSDNSRPEGEFSPWILAFTAARDWLKAHKA